MKKLKSVSNSENNQIDASNTTTNVYTETVFKLGVKYGSIKIIQKIINEGVNINESGSCGRAPLIVFQTEECALMAAKKLRPRQLKNNICKSKKHGIKS